MLETIIANFTHWDTYKIISLIEYILVVTALSMTFITKCDSCNTTELKRSHLSAIIALTVVALQNILYVGEAITVFAILLFLFSFFRLFEKGGKK